MEWVKAEKFPLATVTLHRYLETSKEKQRNIAVRKVHLYLAIITLTSIRIWENRFIDQIEVQSFAASNFLVLQRMNTQIAGYFL